MERTKTSICAISNLAGLVPPLLTRCLLAGLIVGLLSAQASACWHHIWQSNPEISKDYTVGTCPGYTISTPTITGPLYVCPGQGVTFNVIAEDRDYCVYEADTNYHGAVPPPDCQADVLTGTWSCGAGTFPNGNTGMSVNWTAPLTYGSQASISCTVDDGHPVVTLPDTGSRDDSPKAATPITVTVGIHTFGVSQPVEGAHVCYDDEWSYAEVQCAATVDPPCYESEIVWSHDSVSGTTMAWDGGGHTGPSAKLTLSGLPASNSSFGEHSVTADVRDKSTTRHYKLFFSFLPFAKSHPGEGSGITPDWHYYYSQTSASLGVPCDPNAWSGGGYARWEPLVGRYVAYLASTGNIPMLSRTSWGSPCFIDAFAWLSRHELRHVAQLTGFWGNNDHVPGLDLDGDYIPDALETTTGRGGYSMFLPATYPDTVAYGTNPIPDTEDLCMRNDSLPWDVIQLWQNDSADSEDWADMGKQSF